MRLQEGAAVVLLVVLLLSACSTSPDSGSPAPSGTDSSTATPSSGTTASVPPGTTNPTSAIIDLELVGYSWAVIAGSHSIGEEITINLDDRSVQVIGLGTQYGELTEEGVGEIRRLVDQLDLAEIPETYSGPERWVWAEGSDFTITLTTDAERRIYRYSGSPPPELVYLNDFLWLQITPLGTCEATEAVEPLEPCEYRVIS